MIEIKDKALQLVLQEYYETDKNEFSKYEMSVITDIYFDEDSLISADLEDLKFFDKLEKVILRNLYVNRAMLKNICMTKNLRNLAFYNCKIEDLGILENANISCLTIDNCEYEDLFVINNMNCLEDLYLDNNEEVDLKELLIIKRLKKLSLSNTKVFTDEYFIYMNDIECLMINNTGIKDISVTLCLDKLKLLVIDEEQAIENKEFVLELLSKDVNVVDPSNRSVVKYYATV